MVLLVNINKKGFTLIEFMVAIVILSVGLLGLLQTVTYAINHNMNNQLRKEAAMLGDERMNIEKIKPFALISTTPTPYVRSSQTARVVNGAFRNYSVIKSNTDLTDNTKNIDIRITWRYKQERFRHSISSMVSTHNQ